MPTPKARKGFGVFFPGNYDTVFFYSLPLPSKSSPTTVDASGNPNKVVVLKTNNANGTVLPTLGLKGGVIALLDAELASANTPPSKGTAIKAKAYDVENDTTEDVWIYGVKAIFATPIPPDIAFYGYILVVAEYDLTES